MSWTIIKGMCLFRDEKVKSILETLLACWTFVVVVVVVVVVTPL